MVNQVKMTAEEFNAKFNTSVNFDTTFDNIKRCINKVIKTNVIHASFSRPDVVKASHEANRRNTVYEITTPKNSKVYLAI